MRWTSGWHRWCNPCHAGGIFRTDWVAEHEKKAATNLETEKRDGEDGTDGDETDDSVMEGLERLKNQWRMPQQRRRALNHPCAHTCIVTY